MRDVGGLTYATARAKLGTIDCIRRAEHRRWCHNCQAGIRVRPDEDQIESNKGLELFVSASEVEMKLTACSTRLILGVGVIGVECLHSCNCSTVFVVDTQVPHYRD